ncbi:aspartate 1-decarboxylase [Salinisphaera sp. USBA-960]|uniref:aspartate 1-decarboxylase n=1 Tax=Salinisphaera orenii TaxID=856731 RepID=UPI000DBE9A54|nr:aspartate 1-decarboxylase [Salifodinibacter halophilus]NNC25980.1 aspartate 1-decarboxylase [Salifodinibacter halophilus]
MQLTLLKSKLHRACVTDAERDYEGSCAIDADLLDAAGVRPYEQVDVYNVNNGERFTTYAIRAEPGTRVISVNGAAAHLASPGDRVIICGYAAMTEAEADVYQPDLVYLDADNQIIRTSHVIADQAV